MKLWRGQCANIVRIHKQQTELNNHISIQPLCAHAIVQVDKTAHRLLADDLLDIHHGGVGLVSEVSFGAKQDYFGRITIIQFVVLFL